MSGKTKLILFSGIFVRILLSLFTYHSDIVPFPFAAQVIRSGNILNFYDYMWELDEGARELSVYPRNIFNYPPTPYFFLGGISLITTFPFGSFVESFVYETGEILGELRLNLLLLALKLPYFFFDIAIGFLLTKFFDNQRDKMMAFTLWIFNPVNLFATYMMGMFEIIPTFFVILSLYVLLKKETRLSNAAFFLGVGAAFKIFPLLFLPIIASLSASWKKRIMIIFVGVGVYLFTILPFFASNGFRKTALIAGQATKSFYLTLPISGGEAIIPYLAILIFFYFTFLLQKSKQNLWKKYFLILILFFVFTHYHPQWFLWITPFIIFDLVSSRLKHWPLAVLSLISFFGLVMFFDPGLNIGLFAPVSPTLFNSLSLWETWGINIDYNLTRSLIHTLFVGSCLYWLFYYFSFTTDEKN